MSEEEEGEGVTIVSEFDQSSVVGQTREPHHEDPSPPTTCDLPAAAPSEISRIELSQ